MGQLVYLETGWTDKSCWFCFSILIAHLSKASSSVDHCLRSSSLICVSILLNIEHYGIDLTIFCDSFDLWLYNLLNFCASMFLSLKVISKVPCSSYCSVILMKICSVRDTVIFFSWLPGHHSVFPFLFPLPDLTSSSLISWAFAHDTSGLCHDLCFFPSILNFLVSSSDFITSVFIY